MTVSGVVVILGGGFETAEVTAALIMFLVLFDFFISESTSCKSCEDADFESGVRFGRGRGVAPGLVDATIVRSRIGGA